MKRRLMIRTLLLTSACFAGATHAFSQVAEDTTAIETEDFTEEVEAAEVEDDVSVQQTVVVRGQFIPDEKRNTSEVASLIDEGDFALQGDSDAAAALARVAGISTADSKFIYVRGLNERYSSSLLNGSPLPSPAPLRRVAPLDLFPTSALKAVLVQKTYSPNLPGEFAGGLVDLRTKAVPDERFLTIGVSAARNTESSLKKGLMYDGGDSDWLGYDDGTRDLPDGADTLGSAFATALTDDSSLLVMQRGEIAPNFGVDLTAGDRFELSNDISMGILGAVSYSNSWTQKDGIRGLAEQDGADGLRARYQQDRLQTQNNIGLNGLGTIGFDLFADHEIKFTGLVSRSTDKRAQIVSGFNDEDVNERNDTLSWYERELWSSQAQGEHYFPSLMNLKAEWRASYSEAKRDAPYQLSNSYLVQDDGTALLSTSSSAHRFIFEEVFDDTTDFGFDLQLPLSRSGECTFLCEVDLKAGYSYVENDRKADSFIYDISGVTSAINDLRVDYAYDYLSRSGQIGVSVIGGEQFPQRYKATLEIDAAYLGFDAQITPYIRAALGARFEDAIQAVDTQVIGADPATNTVESAIDESDWLPAVTITWNPFEDLQVRGGYSETLTRPQFRELAPAVFADTETDTTFFGNPYLLNASIKNYDIRGEYYFGRDQFFTVGLFYKDMLNPIEEILVPTETIQTTFVNAPSAKLWGAEIEYEQTLPVYDWFETAFFRDREVLVKTNYTWADSEISADGDIFYNLGTNLSPLRASVAAESRLEDGRRLQGQSEHLFNLQVALLNEDARSEMNLLVNYVSERIRSGGIIQRNTPSIIEQPPTTVDLIWNKGFDMGSGEYEFSLKFENIFGQPYESYMERGGDKIFVDTYDKGQVISVGLKRSF